MGIFAPINTQCLATSDIAVRKAILYAIDKKGVIGAGGRRARSPVRNTPLVKGMLGYDAALERCTRTTRRRPPPRCRGAGWTKAGEFCRRTAARYRWKLTAIATSTEYPLLGAGHPGLLRKAGMDAQVERLASPAWLAANIKATCR